MIEQDTVRLLRECDAGVTMGISSIEDVLPFVSSREMKQALEVPIENVRHYSVATATTGKFGAVLERAACFPFAQHMLSDSPGQMTHYGSEAALRKAVEAVDFDRIKTLND